jgi:hypothetical protein
LYGSNILLDPSFEQYAGIFGLNTGPDGETFPGEYGISEADPSKLFWADGSIYSGPLPAWAVHSNEGVNAHAENRWDISDASPSTGVYHARFATDDDFGGGFVTNGAGLSPLGFYLCGFPGKQPVAARVQPGDLMVMSIRGKASVLTDDPRIQLDVATASQDFSTANQWPSFVFPESSLTTSYVLYQFSAFMPEGAYYLNPFFWASDRLQ